MKRRYSPGPGVWTVLCLALAILLWEGMAAAGHVNQFFFSRPSLIWDCFLTVLRDGSLMTHLTVTAREAGLGLLFGGFFGTAAGLTLGVHPGLSRALMPLMTGLNGLPKLALGPLIIVWFGIGLKAKVLISALMVFFVFAFNLYSGVRSVDRDLLFAVRLMGATRHQTIRKVIWPACLPWLLTSLRTGLGLSISGAIVGEYLGASRDLGWAIATAGERYDTTKVLCLVLVIVVIVVLLDLILRLLERRLLRWRET